MSKFFIQLVLFWFGVFFVVFGLLTVLTLRFTQPSKQNFANQIAERKNVLVQRNLLLSQMRKMNVQDRNFLVVLPQQTDTLRQLNEKEKSLLQKKLIKYPFLRSPLLWYRSVQLAKQQSSNLSSRQESVTTLLSCIEQYTSILEFQQPISDEAPSWEETNTYFATFLGPVKKTVEANSIPPHHQQIQQLINELEQLSNENKNDAFVSRSDLEKIFSLLSQLQSETWQACLETTDKNNTQQEERELIDEYEEILQKLTN